MCLVRDIKLNIVVWVNLMFLPSVPLRISQCHDNHHARNHQQSVRHGFLTERCTHKININHCCRMHQVYSWSALAKYGLHPKFVISEFNTGSAFFVWDAVHGLGKTFNVGTTLPSIPMFDHKNVAKHVGSRKRQWWPCWCIDLWTTCILWLIWAWLKNYFDENDYSYRHRCEARHSLLLYVNWWKHPSSLGPGLAMRALQRRHSVDWKGSIRSRLKNLWLEGSMEFYGIFLGVR